MIRDYADDENELHMIHSQMGLDYALPDLSSPLFAVKKVAIDSRGIVIGAGLIRITAEAFLLLSPKLSNARKLLTMKSLQPAVLSEAWRLGIDEVECRIPETVLDANFEASLRYFGWNKDRPDWWPWSRSTKV